MVYQIFDDGIETAMLKGARRPRVGQRTTRGGSCVNWAKSTNCAHPASLDNYGATLLILLIKIFLFIYDAISLPIYFLLQRPDRQAGRAQEKRSHQVDVNTWIRDSQMACGIRGECKRLMDESGHRRSHKFLAMTMGEIFAEAVREHHSRPCLGYRALVTCPVFVTNQSGESVLQDKSFRSDYTWYTYNQVGQRVQDIASGLYKHSIYPGDRGLFMASSCLEWFCVAQACFQLNVQLALAPDANEPIETMALILSESQAGVIFVTCNQLDKLCNLLLHLYTPNRWTSRTGLSPDGRQAKVAKLEKIILIDWQFSVDFNESIFATLGETLNNCSCNLVIVSIGQIEEAGNESPIELQCSNALSQEHPPVWPEQAQTSTNHFFKLFDCFNSSSAQLNRTRWLAKSNANIGAKDVGRSNQSLAAPLQHRTSRLKTTTAKPDDLAIIVYSTYGTLGQLKPIMVSHEQLARSNSGLFLDGMIGQADVHCTILPLASMIELMSEMCVFSRGGCIGYSCNMQTFFYDGQELFPRDKSDLEALAPTYLLVTPYILERLRGSVQNYHQQSRLDSMLNFVHKHVLYNYKKHWARWHFETPIVDRVFCSRLRRLFGAQIKYILCNGGADCSETKDFFAYMLGLPVIELYGPDEALASFMSVNYKRRTTSSAGMIGPKRRHQEKSGYNWRLFQFNVEGNLEVEGADLEVYQNIQLMPPTINRNNTHGLNLSRNLLFVSSVLCPMSGARIRLENWEEFRVCDRPYPRGRLLIGGDLVCQGYFKRPALEGEAFFKDKNSIRWFRTHDIARVFPNGSFEIISAISDMIKMANGQFISLSQVEHILRDSQFVDNVCAICNDDRTFVINLVVPNFRQLAHKSPGEANLNTCVCLQPEPEEFIDVEFRREVCNDRLLCEFISDHLNEMVARAGLASVANSFLLVPEIWTPESELVTSAFKPKRAAIQKFYARDIQSIVGLGLSKSNSRRLLARR